MFFLHEAQKKGCHFFLCDSLVVIIYALDIIPRVEEIKP